MSDPIPFAERNIVFRLPVTLAEHPLGEHGMDVRNDDDRMRDIITETLEFFRRHLGLETS